MGNTLAGCHPSGPPCQLSRDAYREQLEKDKFKRHNNNNQLQNTESPIKSKSVDSYSTTGGGSTSGGTHGGHTTNEGGGGGATRTTYGDPDTISHTITRSETTPTRQSSYTKYTRTKTKGLSGSTSTKIKTTTTERGCYTETVTNYTKLKKADPYFQLGSITSSIMSPFTGPIRERGPLCPGGGGGFGHHHGGYAKGYTYTKGGGYSPTAMIQASWRRQRHTKKEETVKVKQYATRMESPDLRPTPTPAMPIPTAQGSFESTPGGDGYEHGQTPGHSMTPGNTPGNGFNANEDQKETPEFRKYTMTLGQKAHSKDSILDSITPQMTSAPQPISASKSKSKRIPSSKGSNGSDDNKQHQRKRSKHVRFSGIGSHTRSNAISSGRQRIAIPELDANPIPVPVPKKMHQRIILNDIAEGKRDKNYIIRITSASLNEVEFATFAENAVHHHQQENSDALSEEDEEYEESECSSTSSASSETSSTESSSTVYSSDHEFDDTEDDLERCQILHLP